jgi:hypothetical protein
MSVESKIYNLLIGTGTTLPVSPIYQIQQVKPPSIIYDQTVLQPQYKGRGDVPEEVDLVVLLYDQNHQNAIDQGEIIKNSIDRSCNADFSVIRFQQEETSWSDPNYILLQRYRLKLK